MQDFDRSRKFLLRAYKLNPACQDITNEIQKLNEMVAKYKSLQKDIYKRMFSGADEKPDETETPAKKEKNSEDFFISENISFEQAKTLIETKMK